MRIKRKLLVVNDVFQPLTDSTQPHGRERIEVRRQQESVLLSFVRLCGTVSYLWAL